MTQSKNEISGVWGKDVSRYFLTIFMLFSLLHISCEKSDESSLLFYENDIADYSTHTDDLVFHLCTDDFSVFKDELTYFLNSLTIKDGLYQVNRTHCRLQSEKHKWVPLFTEAIESVNKMITDGSLTINELNQDKDLILTRDSFINKSGGTTDTVPGNFRYRNLGGGLHSIWISHEVYEYSLLSGKLISPILLLGSFPAQLVGIGLATASVFNKFVYDKFGQGGGAEYYFWNFGQSYFIWVNYPPPINFDEEMEQ